MEFYLKIHNILCLIIQSDDSDCLYLCPMLVINTGYISIHPHV